MLAARTAIYDWDTPLDDMDQVADLAWQLCDRALLRYLVPRDVRRFEYGTTNRQFVTPTPCAPGETISWLALPAVTEPRRYVLLLDPGKLHDVYGPRWVRFGGGIEYILNSGFAAEVFAEPLEPMHRRRAEQQRHAGEAVQTHTPDERSRTTTGISRSVFVW